jgi:hypothetical protein
VLYISKVVGVGCPTTSTTAIVQMSGMYSVFCDFLAQVLLQNPHKQELLVSVFLISLRDSAPTMDSSLVPSSIMYNLLIATSLA